MTSKFITLLTDAALSDGELSGVTKASTNHGGMTIIDAHVYPGGAGTLDITALNYGASGTVAGGTVLGISGGSAAISADTPVQLAVTAANAFLDAGEWLILIPSGGALPTNSTVVIEYVDGVVTQG